MDSEAKSDLTNGFVLSNNPFLAPFGVLTLALLAFLNLFVRRRLRKNLQFLDLQVKNPLFLAKKMRNRGPNLVPEFAFIEKICHHFKREPLKNSPLDCIG